jgi:hypothetical protein
MMVGMLVLPRGTTGITDASATRNAPTPITRPAASTTHMERSRNVTAHVLGQPHLVRTQRIEVDRTARQ